MRLGSDTLLSNRKATPIIATPRRNRRPRSNWPRVTTLPQPRRCSAILC